MCMIRAATRGALIVALVGGCSSAPPVKEQLGLELQVITDSQTNPDEMNRAAPIEVRIYELKSSAAFESADFYALQNDAKNTLSGDVLAVDEFILRPGASRMIRRRVSGEATAIGVIAAYRNLGKSVWRDTWRLPVTPDAAWYRAVIPAQKLRLKIRLEEQAVSITELGKGQ
jgi:type VI secretion system protein VasD